MDFQQYTSTVFLQKMHLPTVCAGHRWPRPVRFLAAVALACSTVVANAADSLHVSVQVSNYNGYQVSCFGMKDGWITVNPTGGEAPYHYKWSNGGSMATAGDLAAGYYKVDVIDQGAQVVTVEVTLEQPLPMKLDVDVYEYSNGYNISC